MKLCAVVMSLAMWAGALGLAEGMTLPLLQAPYQLILSRVGDFDGFGFGSRPGTVLPDIPAGPGDPDPFDAPDDPCALQRTWTHDITADLPAEARIVSAVLIVNIAGVQPEIFRSVLAAGTTALPLIYLDQGELGSGPIVVPLKAADLADGLLNVTIIKGFTRLGRVVCDAQFYDASLLAVVIQTAP